MILSSVLGGGIFGIAAFLSSLVSAKCVTTIRRFDDGPPVVQIPTWLPMLCAALLGGLLGWRQFPLTTLILLSPLITVFIACLFIDAQTGIIPDILTLPSLGIVLLIALIHHDFSVFIGAAFLCIPFGVIAYSSKGLGMGWGDVKLVALAGALLGPTVGLLGACLACITAFASAKFRHTTSEPIAFGPYLITSFALVFGIFVGIFA